MQTLDHHLYSLDHLEGSGHETLQFVHKERLEPDQPEMRTVAPGTTNEEVLRVVIDRIESQNVKFPCDENKFSAVFLKTALFWMEERTRARKLRGVEGKAIA